MIVFGPVKSRRFGNSLGVDLSPETKQCNFDCVYCELNKSKTVKKMHSVIDPNIVVSEIENSLIKNKGIDVLTFSANGEPTLYPYLLETIMRTKEILEKYPGIKTLILSNGSLFGKTEVKKALLHFDIVKFSIDSVDDRKFKLVDRPNDALEIQEIKNGIKGFAKVFKGILIAEVLIVKGLNDDRKSMKGVADFLLEVGVSRVDLSTVDRPSSYNVKPIEYEELLEIAELFTNLNVCIASRSNGETKTTPLDLNSEQLIGLISRRPLSLDECETMLNDSSKTALQALLEKKQIAIKNVSNVRFYTVVYKHGKVRDM